MQETVGSKEQAHLDKGEGSRQAVYTRNGVAMPEAAVEGSASGRRPFVQIQEQRKEHKPSHQQPSMPAYEQAHMNFRSMAEHDQRAALTRDLAVQLERLSALHQDGSLTQIEFTAAKQVPCNASHPRDAQSAVC